MLYTIMLSSPNSVRLNLRNQHINILVNNADLRNRRDVFIFESDAIYTIAKGGLAAMTRALTADFGRHGITVNCGRLNLSSF
jgi:hypothetical protein